MNVGQKEIDFDPGTVFTNKYKHFFIYFFILVIHGAILITGRFLKNLVLFSEADFKTNLYRVIWDFVCFQEFFTHN